MARPEATRRPPTIRDVAERAGVSKSLVSLVLNDSPKVRPARREAVRVAIEELGYRPNAAARSLIEARTRAVGVLLNDLRQPFYMDALDAVSEALHGQDMTMLLGDARLDRRADERLVNTFMDMRVDGLVLVGSMTPSQAVLEAAGRIPTVVVGTFDIDRPRVDISAQDDDLGATLATRHLIDLGHRRIGHVTGTFESVMALRRTAYERTMTEAGLADEIRVVAGDITEAGGYRSTMEILSSGPRPTALVMGADVVLVGALRAATELGLRVPRDLSVIGFDNSPVSRLPGAEFTTIDIETDVMGRRAVELLIERIERPDRRRRIRRTTPSLVVRRTTAAPRDRSPRP